MPDTGAQVLVVGASIPGLTAARTLRDCGAAVEIVERQLDPPDEGTGIYLLGNAVRTLDTPRVGDQVAERAIHIRRQRTVDHRGRALFVVDIDQLWDGVGAVWRCPGRTCIECCSPAPSSASTKKCYQWAAGI